MGESGTASEVAGGRGVLVVEDDANLRNAYRLVLNARGLEVATAGTAREALDRISDAPPATVVADLGLPDRQGVEVVTRLCEAAPEARVVVLTGRDDPTLRDACRDAGAVRYLVKPVAPDDLLAVVEGDG